MFTGVRPDISPAQVIGLLAGGIPVAANLLRAFGVFDLTPDQEAALNDVMQWAVVLAGALFVADAGLRSARNAAEAKIQAAAASQPQVAGSPYDEGLPSDEEELGSPPPDDPDA